MSSSSTDSSCNFQSSRTQGYPSIRSNSRRRQANQDGDRIPRRPTARRIRAHRQTCNFLVKRDGQLGIQQGPSGQVEEGVSVLDLQRNRMRPPIPTAALSTVARLRRSDDTASDIASRCHYTETSRRTSGRRYTTPPNRAILSSICSFSGLKTYYTDAATQGPALLHFKHKALPSISTDRTLSSFKDTISYNVARPSQTDVSGLYLISCVAGCGSGVDAAERSFYLVTSIASADATKRVITCDGSDISSDEEIRVHAAMYIIRPQGTRSPSQGRGR
ncbi:hypothetical protein C8F01DRAFT_722334 [Mycena amicta]|nr:hypothetical protein C8F01DRAFT_722334 [Mycena amicta]